jgi:mannose-6-phosphate isomerase-like protein (cupin superfamily)
MKVYKKSSSHLFCGYWNGSDIEIGLTENLKSIPENDVLHYHPYKEYYLILEGKGAIEVIIKEKSLPNSKIIVESEEIHN